MKQPVDPADEPFTRPIRKLETEGTFKETHGRQKLRIQLGRGRLTLEAAFVYHISLEQDNPREI